MADLISGYLDTLTRELSFDPALARRMREEAEDHLRESVASDPRGATLEAERRAISRFGPARDIAAQCAIPSLVKQAKGVGATVTLIVAGVLIAMKSRIAWYGASQHLAGGDPDLDGIRAIVSSVDRYAFWCALLIAVCGWAYIGIARAAGATGAVWQKRLRLSLLLCAAATTAVVITVASDILLTALKFFPAGWSVAIFFPALTVGLEVTLAVILIAQIRIAMSRLAASAQLFT